MWLKILNSEHIAAITNLWSCQSLPNINAILKRSDEAIFRIKVRLQDGRRKILQSQFHQLEDLCHGKVSLIAQKNFIFPIWIYPLRRRENLRGCVLGFHFDHDVILNFDPDGRFANGTSITDDLKGVVCDFKFLPFRLCLRELAADTGNCQYMFCRRDRVV